MVHSIFAQMGGAPTSGASNARDFQPETRNPQTGQVNTQPQAGTLQETGNKELLDNPNLSLDVDADPNATETGVNTPAGTINWLFVIVAAVVIVVAVEAFFRKRDRKKSVLEKKSPASKVVSPEPDTDTDTEPETVTEPEVTKESPEEPVKKPSKKKKSKNKKK